MKKTILSVAILGLSGFAMAEAPSFNYVSAGYSSTDVDLGAASADVTGFGISASRELTDQVFAGISYSSADSDDLGMDYDEDLLQLGLGYILTEDSNTRTYVAVSYGTGNVEESNLLVVDEDVTVLGVAAGIRSNRSDELELSASISAARTEIGNIDDESIALSVGAEYFFSPELSAGLGLSTSEGDKTYGISVNFYY